MSAPDPRRLGRALDALAAAAALAAVAVYAAGAWQWVRYPWDLAPDEGLTLDYARRLVHAPGSLFGSVVPVPIGYPPLLAALLVPFVEGTTAPLFGARLLACAWTGVIAASVYRLVRRAGSGGAALVAAALVLAPPDLSFWYVIVRPDGLMIALWLLSAVVLLPERLGAGGGELSWPRALGGGLILLGAVAAKPTAVLHGAPLVLGWLLVDRRSAARLMTVVLAGGLAVMAGLQIASDGGFFATLRLWSVHARQPGLAPLILLLFAKLAGPVILLALAGLWASHRARRGADPSLLLVAGGLLALPALSKVGAWWNYLLPAYLALVVAGGRGFAHARAASPRLERLGVGAGVVLVAVLLSTRTFPVPNAEDEKTAAAFYAFLKGRGAPILAVWPEYAYFVLGQPVEMEGSGFPYVAKARVPGVEVVLDRMRSGAYRTISLVTHLWPDDAGYQRTLTDNYRVHGVCELRYFYGQIRFVLLVPAADPAVFSPAPGTRCRAVPPAAPTPAAP